MQAGAQTGTTDPRDGGSAAGAKSSSGGSDDGTLERVVREAAISASVSHPNVVATYHHHLERVTHKDPGVAAADGRNSLDCSVSGSGAGASAEGMAAGVVGAGGGGDGGAEGGGGSAGGGGSEAQVWRLVQVLELCDAGSLRDCLQGELFAGHDVEPESEQQQQLKKIQQQKQQGHAGAGTGGGQGVRAGPEAGGQGTEARAGAETAAAAVEELSGAANDTTGEEPLSTAWFSRAQPHPHARVVVLLALQVARGVAYLHSRGVVHCDLSSANVLLKRAGGGGGGPDGPDVSSSGGAGGRSRGGGEGGGGGVVAQGQRFWCSYVAKVRRWRGRM